MIDMPGWGINGFLQIHTVHGVPHEKCGGPLILLVSPGSTEDHVGLAISHGK